MGINFINTTMAGHAGADDLAGVSVGTGIFFPFEGAAIGLLMAGTPIIAQLIGKNEKSSIPFVVRTGIYIALALSMLFLQDISFLLMRLSAAWDSRLKWNILQRIIFLPW